MAHHGTTLRNRSSRPSGWALGLLLALGGGGALAQTAVEYSNVAASQGAASSAGAMKVAKAAPGAGQTQSAGAPAAPSRGDGPNCSGEVTQPTMVNVATGKSTLLRLPEPIIRRSLGNPKVVEARLVSPQLLYVLGMDNGATNMILQGKSGKCVVVDVVVGFDTAGLRAKIAELLPDETGVKVSSAADSLVLSGTVSDALNANQIVTLANAYVRTGPPGSNQSGGGAANMASPTTQNLLSPRVVNMMAVAAPQQVLLEVKVAEVNKTLLEQMGAGFNFQLPGIGFIRQFQSAFPINGSGSSSKGVLALFTSKKTQALLEGQDQNDLLKILAEPNLIAISGQEGSFLAGGKIFIPVSQTGTLGGASTITLEEKEFGVGLRFTPTVLSGGRINLKVAPEVSDVNPEGIGVSLAGSSGGTSILPSILTRRASTTVQLMDGQSFAIGGLISNNVRHNITKFPFLGDVPILGTLFRSDSFKNERTELLFVVTVHLIKPLPADYALPTDSYTPPGRARRLLFGRMEGAAPDKPGAPDQDNDDDQAQAAPPPEAPRAKPASGFEVK
ncbi:pilus assembly protein CpaC [Oryzomicrobium terrae]|uniref:Pilus assembly protein CpaC n=1 Tax=Oryzomicrobium terrae TaxID=1735038 RepID=A0A5C1E4A3_9RHOO|nr:type II and III secretion system protein family protein [Oryzomicrobium terrae]QEL63554.1 pilus assembly protein CpaC [Oryzomicrobium terrae]